MTSIGKALFLLLFSLTNVWAYEFTHFQLNKNFGSRKQMGVKSMGSTKGFSDASIMPDLTAYMLANYQEIGNEQFLDLLNNHDLGGGVVNFSGFTWYKPMINYDITANRDLAPHFASEKWIVQDTLVISIEAATLLQNLSDLEVINITPSQLEAFAGLTFKRKYHYFHFADNYLDGLSSDYSKLFLSFLKYNPEGIFDMGEYEVMKRSDEFTFNAGGKVEAPLGNGLEVRAGVLVTYAFNNIIQVQKLGSGEAQPGENVRLSIEKDFNTKSSAQLSLQYDFFNLLKLTLLSSELEYSYGKSRRTYLTLLDQDQKTIQEDPRARGQLNSHIKGGDKIDYWLDRITSFEDRVKQNLTSKFNFLLFGSLKKKATEQIVIVKNGIKKTFFKYYYESKSYVQGLLSRLFSDAIRAIFDFGPMINESSHNSDQIYLEYEKEEDIKQPMTVSDESQFSLKVSKSFFADKTVKWYHRGRKNFILKSIKNWTVDTENILTQVSRENLIGPISVNSDFTIDEQAFTELKKVPELVMIGKHLRVCGLEASWLKDYSKRYRRSRAYRENRRDRRHRCAYQLIKKYAKFKESMDKLIDLNILRDYLSLLVKHTEDYETFADILGSEHIFITGSITAKQRQTGKTYTYFYKSGQFNGLGVIDRFKQAEINVPVYLK
ncbi:MAG: hypothetical protein VYA54_08790 [Bdellovibrionota bacterium]|nr:hypothetical protein [Bdellovibrionota bacterium]